MGKPELRVLTNSEKKVRRRCQHEHHLSYDLGYRPVDSIEELNFGTAWHAAQECWWMGVELALCLEHALQFLSDPYEEAKLRALMLGYDVRWAYETPFSEVVGVEREFRAPLINPDTGAASKTYRNGGKMDVLLKRKFVEHKTTSEDIGLGSVYWRNLMLDSQVSTYYAGAKSLGHEVDGCIYDVVRKPGLRPSNVPIRDSEGVKIVLGPNGERVRTKDNKKWRESGDAELGYVLQTRIETAKEYEARIVADIAQDPDRYYQRGDVVRLEDEEREAARDDWALTQQMREDAKLGRHPRNADACKRYGRMCGFFDVCTGVDSVHNTSRFVKLDNVHPELSPDAEAAE